VGSTTFSKNQAIASPFPHPFISKSLSPFRKGGLRGIPPLAFKSSFSS
jgi:hypothetical protein